MEGSSTKMLFRWSMMACFIGWSVLSCQANAADLNGTLKKIKDSGQIVIGFSESLPPFSSYDADKNPAGYSIDICMRVVDTVKRELNISDLPVKFVPVTPTTRIALLANGTIDLECASTTNTLSREEQVDFSMMHFMSSTRCLVKAGGGVHEIEDFGNKVVALAQGSNTVGVVNSWIQKLSIPNVKILNISNFSEGVLAVDSDRADAFCSDDAILYTLRQKSPARDRLEVIGRPLSFEPYGLMLRRDDSAFRLAVNKTLAELFRSGDATTLYHKWFDTAGIPLSEKLATVFQVQALPR
ncbi:MULTISPECIES: amino acid ABC transporter substrate-binding protein [unclassified Bradyrhizobium]|uniref:amino acid ABC transporter substrate-binding protein n=1 Tax=unclassified Bradyrhizobium TaxID=2631580 RepID=UPI001FFA3156|nr:MULTISPECIES: amino acid ABC transporter substrate-binding protein [unclassified Bradyrhizobium]MCK1766377.1 amino acid ABC transporter substrate-binding protein [Bradyrhizobium sp. 136]